LARWGGFEPRHGGFTPLFKARYEPLVRPS
jgi:hypothetical protein